MLSAKMMLASLPQDRLDLLTHDDEGATLYQCLCYHDVLSRFGLQCWRYRKHDPLFNWPAHLDPLTSPGALRVTLPKLYSTAHNTDYELYVVIARFRLRDAVYTGI